MGSMTCHFEALSRSIKKSNSSNHSNNNDCNTSNTTVASWLLLGWLAGYTGSMPQAFSKVCSCPRPRERLFKPESLGGLLGRLFPGATEQPRKGHGMSLQAAVRTRPLLPQRTLKPKAATPREQASPLQLMSR